MTSFIQKAWQEVVTPLVQRPKRFQVAALCFRSAESGEKQVLLITSRDTGRWILPKGWPIDGHDAPGSALQEAWEEAGVANGNIEPEPLGEYEYTKRFEGGASAQCLTRVFPVEVRELETHYPEAEERTRRWVSPAEAAEMVDEPQLREILRTFGK